MPVILASSFVATCNQAIKGKTNPKKFATFIRNSITEIPSEQRLNKEWLVTLSTTDCSADKNVHGESVFQISYGKLLINISSKYWNYQFIWFMISFILFKIFNYSGWLRINLYYFIIKIVVLSVYLYVWMSVNLCEASAHRSWTNLPTRLHIEQGELRK